MGDIHGRLDLLEDLLAKIHAELQHRPAAKTLLVFVGDLIDRGPSSAQVIERLRTYRRAGIRPVFILGNHEEVLLRILGGDGSVVDSWLTVRRCSNACEAMASIRQIFAAAQREKALSGRAEGNSERARRVPGELRR